MDASLAFWTFALLDMCGVLGFGIAGVRAVQRGDTAQHRRCMLLAAALVALFVSSYVVKLAVLGREDRSSWGLFSVWVLGIHELCVFTMIAAGAIAGSRARRLRRSRNFTRRPEDSPAPARSVQWHRGAGRTAVVAAGVGLLFAFLVLAGMYRRAGFL